MRNKIEVTGLDPAQWAWLQANVNTSYALNPHDVPVCAVFVNEDETEERHSEMPLILLTGLLCVLYAQQSAPVADSRPRLPSPEEVRNLTALDAATLARQMNAPDALTCDHGMPVLRTDDYGNGNKTLTFSDGCQSYGPWS